MNKHYFSLGLVFLAGLGLAEAQTNRERFRNLGPRVEMKLTDDQPEAARRTAKPTPRKTGSGPQVSATYGTQIGQTYYDLQSNASTANRIKRDANGGVHVTWTESCLPDPGGNAFPDRGAGYNYLAPGSTTWSEGADGTCDLPNAIGGLNGVNSARVGWPEVLIFEGSQKEMLLAHNGTGYSSVQRTGYGSITSNPFSANQVITTLTGQGHTWPRAINVGSVVHMVGSSNDSVNGVFRGISYYRSADEGATFTEYPLPGLTAANYSVIGADAYALHANGSNVAIIAGRGTDAWAMWKSTDGGQSFTRTEMRSAFTMADTIMSGTDTLYETNEQFHAVIVDNNGMAHAFSGQQIAAIDGNGEYAGYYPLNGAGMWYWNESMPTDGAKMIVHDVDGIGDIGDGTYLTPARQAPYQNSMISMPNVALTANNELYLVYVGLVPGTSNTGDATGQSFRDIYAMKIDPASGTQSLPLNIARDIAMVGPTDFEEDVYASVAHEIGSDNMLHMTWMSDAEPGLYVQVDVDAPVLNEIMYYGFNVATQNWGVMVPLTSTAPVSEHINSISAMPNPTTGVAQLNLDLKQGANVAVKVTNILGQEVMNVKSSYLNAGANTMKLDLSKQADGVYLYTVTTDGFSVTNRIVKQ
jgi:hypothetical protein